MTIIKKIAANGIMLSLALAVLGSSPLYASEVTGTLSSGATNPTTNSATNGSIEGNVNAGTSSGSVSGTVESDDRNSSSGGSRRTNDNSPVGSVLGASTGPLLAQANPPAFPNTGFGPGDTGLPWNMFLLAIACLSILWLFVPRVKNSRKKS